MENQHIELDECEFCVQEFWEPWIQELLNVEDEAKEEETRAIFIARDSTSRSERQLALHRRRTAADALLSARAAKFQIMKVLAAINLEKQRRLVVAKAKSGIALPMPENPEISHKEEIYRAKLLKKEQEEKYAIWKIWQQRWAEWETKRGKPAIGEEDIIVKKTEPEKSVKKVLVKEPESEGSVKVAASSEKEPPIKKT